MPNVYEIFDMLTGDELDHIEAGRSASFAWAFAKRSGLPGTAATIATLGETYREIRRRLGYAE